MDAQRSDRLSSSPNPPPGMFPLHLAPPIDQRKVLLPAKYQPTMPRTPSILPHTIRPSSTNLNVPPPSPLFHPPFSHTPRSSSSAPASPASEPRYRSSLPATPCTFSKARPAFPKPARVFNACLTVRASSSPGVLENNSRRWL
jgi:hypothetical protein